MRHSTGAHKNTISQESTNSAEFDIIIIGAGISGLYFNYKLKQLRPKLRTLLLERDKIGGRAGNEEFYGANVVTGAGIGRHKKDQILLKLIQEFQLETHSFIATKKHIGSVKIDAGAIFSELKSEFKKRGEPVFEFKKFAREIIGPKNYQAFLETVGYTDFEKEDCYEVLNHYGMADNYKTFRAFSVPWAQLVDSLANYITKNSQNNLIAHENVISINRKQPKNKGNQEIYKNCHSQIEVETNRAKYKCAHLVIATDIDSIRYLLDPIVSTSNPKIYRGIKGQPFIRTYGKFTAASTKLIMSKITEATCVISPLQKIIPMANGVYMIAYADNASAIYLSKFSEDTPQNRAKYSGLLYSAIGLQLEIIAIKSYFWKNGTHYYSPISGSRIEFLSHIREPANGIHVIGEAVSRDQGWTKGALETAQELIFKLGKSLPK